MRTRPVLPLLLALGCQTAAEPAIEIVARLTVRADTVVATFGPLSATVSVPVTLTNDGGGDVYWFPCNRALDRHENGLWSPVKMFAGCTLMDVRIGPGQQHELTVLAVAQQGQDWSPASVPGTYRVGLVLHAAGNARRIVSSPFTVRF